MIYFETQRLIFRDWNDEDLKEFRLMNKDERIMEYFPKLMTDEETDGFYNRIKAELRDLGYGLYAVETKHNNEFIGFIGLHVPTFEADFTPCVEIGWRLEYKAWGKGYATEGAEACLGYGFNKLGLKSIYSFTAKINYRSENVMRKIGMTKVKEFTHPNVDKNSPLCNHVLYCANIST